ncbi:PREDICTED: uncharacterized protein LOC18608379 [Theobroma cacao]|uniref:Uncharacterized protein LOC18608379 n=1 Tax=Theobroma cacao TaxID=3641 RepID=A0AB32VWW3_THECC|nr:PREDICTED: uncharacterized protein LOC18608379 [Theobroma cacao]
MASSSFMLQAPPIFDGDNYLIWFVKMKAYLGAFGLWDVVETGGEPPALPANPTIAQINQHNEEVAKPYKALSYIHSAVTDAIFTRIMTCETPKEAWDKLKEEFQGSERTRQRQILNLMREFEVLKMKDNEPVKEYIDKLVLIVNQVRLLGGDMPEKRLIEKVLVSIPERFESIISFLGWSKDLSKLTLTEVVDALQASEYRRAIRLDEITENALHAKEEGQETRSVW